MHPGTARGHSETDGLYARLERDAERLFTYPEPGQNRHLAPGGPSAVRAHRREDERLEGRLLQPLYKPCEQRNESVDVAASDQHSDAAAGERPLEARGLQSPVQRRGRVIQGPADETLFYVGHQRELHACDYTSW
jgi:hypothetical protein